MRINTKQSGIRWPQLTHAGKKDKQPGRDLFPSQIGKQQQQQKPFPRHVKNCHCGLPVE